MGTERTPDLREQTGVTPGRSRLRAWAIEGLVALILIALLLGPALIYAGGWPPVYSVESPSMEHGSIGVGTLDVGDLFIVRRVPSVSEVITYAEGRASGHTTFGDFGDVILYNRLGGGTPVVHRAILWLDYEPDSASGTWSAPELLELANGRDWSRSDGGTSPMRMGTNVELRLLGVRTVGGDVVIDLLELDKVDGFITKGDNPRTNRFHDQDPKSNISSRHPIEAGQFVGVARGELPCVGVLTLAIIGKTSYVTGDHAACAVLVIAFIVFIGWVGHALVVRGIRYAMSRREKRAGGQPPLTPPDAPPAPTAAGHSSTQPLPGIQEGRRIAGAGTIARRRAAARRAAARGRIR